MFKRLLLIGLVGIGLAACSGGMSCTTISILNSDSLDCSGGFDKLSEAQELRFEFTEDAVVSNLTNSTVTVSVERGSVRVSYEAQDGSTVSGEASPGSPVTLTTHPAIAFMDEVHVTIEPLGMEASGVKYQAQFSE